MPNEPHKAGEYDAAYYAALRAGGRASADRVLPQVLDLVAPASIVDFGCGSGGWLTAAARLGVADIQGVDGAWVSRESLEIPADRFRPVDLSAPLDLGRRFDLAFCLEVAEHLPRATASVLVEILTAHAPVVLFSAAIPGQGGEGHINEAWPSFWRAHFDASGSDCFDILRGAIWEDAAIETWYRQNLLLFVGRDHLAKNADLATRLAEAPAPPLDIVHPELFGEEAATRARLAAEIEGLGRAYQAQTAEMEELKAENARLGAAWSVLDRELANLRGSLSWRLSAPLRAIGQRMHRGKES
jgi:SAM-dependent methyltransferase